MESFFVLLVMCDFIHCFLPKEKYLIQFLDKNDLSPLFALKGFFFFSFLTLNTERKKKIKAQGTVVQLLWNKSIFKCGIVIFLLLKVGILCA